MGQVTPVGGDLSCAMVSDGWALQENLYWPDHECTEADR